MREDKKLLSPKAGILDHFSHNYAGIPNANMVAIRRPHRLGR